MSKILACSIMLLVVLFITESSGKPSEVADVHDSLNQQAAKEAPEPEVCAAEGKECCQFPGQQCARAEYNKGMHTCCDGMECSGAKIGACTWKRCKDGTNDCNRCVIRGESTCQPKPEEPVPEAPEPEVCAAEGKECCQFPGQQCARAEYNKGMHKCCDGMECSGAKIGGCTMKRCRNGTDNCNRCVISGESTCQIIYDL